MKNLTTLTCALAIASSALLSAQSSETTTKSVSETTTKTKIDIKNGKDVKVTGCVEAGFDGGFVLTNASEKKGDVRRYILVSDDDDFAKVVGQRVLIEGKSAGRGDGKVEIKTETKVEGAGGKDTHSKTETSGDEFATPYLGVKHMTKITGSCR